MVFSTINILINYSFQICFTSKDPKHLECSEKGNHQLPWQNFLKTFPVCCPSEFTKGVKTRSRSMHRGLSLIENLGAVVFYVHVVGVRYINWCLFLLHTIYYKQFMSSFFLIWVLNFQLIHSKSSILLAFTKVIVILFNSIALQSLSCSIVFFQFASLISWRYKAQFQHLRSFIKYHILIFKSQKWNSQHLLSLLMLLI